MPVPQITITSAGFAAIVNAEHSGTAPVKLTHVGLTAQHFDVATVGATVPGEAKRLTTFGGQAVAADTLHLNVRDDTADAYTLRGFGLYLQDGTLFAVYSQPAPIMEKASAAVMLLATDIRFAKVNATSIEVGDIDFVNPPATNTRVGVVRLATDLEAEAASDPTLALTPFGLARYINKRFGDGAPSAFVKGLLGLATAALFRTELGLRGAALRDEGHSNGLDADLLDGNHGDYYRDWRNLTGVPSQFPPSPHTHVWSSISGQPDTATRWPTWGEVTSKPATYPPSGHSHPWTDIAGQPDTATRWPTWNEVTNKPATYAPAAHTHAEYLPKSAGDTQTLTGSLCMYAGVGATMSFRNGGNTSQRYYTSHNDTEWAFCTADDNGGFRAVAFAIQRATGQVNFGGAIQANNVTAVSTLYAGAITFNDSTQGFQYLWNAFGTDNGYGCNEYVNNYGGGTGGHYFYGRSIKSGAVVRTAWITKEGGVRSNPGSSPNPNSNVHTLGFVTSGSYGGGYGMVDGAQNIGMWSSFGALNFGFGSNGGALISRMTLTTSGALSTTGGYDFGSSLKLKDRIGEVPYTLDDLDRIDVFIGKYKAAYNDDGRQRIFQSAESLADAAPETVDLEGVHFAGENVGSLKLDQVQALQTHFLQLLNGVCRKHAEDIAELRAALRTLKVVH